MIGSVLSAKRPTSRIGEARTPPLRLLLSISGLVAGACGRIECAIVARQRAPRSSSLESSQAVPGGAAGQRVGQLLLSREVTPRHSDPPVQARRSRGVTRGCLPDRLCKLGVAGSSPARSI